MALVFFRSPEEPASCAVEVARALRVDPFCQIRMGVHSGPVFRFTNINAKSNVAGDGINMAQRVMDCGDAGHILVSRHVAQMVGQMSTWAPYLHDLGEHAVKHGAKVHLYNLFTGELGNPAIPEKVKARGAVIPPSRVEPETAPEPWSPRWGSFLAVIGLIMLAAVIGIWWNKASTKTTRVTEGVPKVPEARAQEPVQATVGDKRVNPKDGLTYAWIPPGTFQMGCSPGDGECYSDEKPAKAVTISKGFDLGESEVTQAAYQKVTGKNPSYYKGADRPVEQVTWDEAKSYCLAVGGRLPSEAEWEYAARAGTTAARYGALDKVAWYDKNTGSSTEAVKQKEPNAWGLYDMLGNVWEWVEDLYPGTLMRVLRGGSWRHLSRYARASFRSRLDPSVQNDNLGFRCAWE